MHIAYLWAPRSRQILIGYLLESKIKLWTLWGFVPESAGFYRTSTSGMDTLVFPFFSFFVPAAASGPLRSLFSLRAICMCYSGRRCFARAKSAFCMDDWSGGNGYLRLWHVGWRAALGCGCHLLPVCYEPFSAIFLFLFHRLLTLLSCSSWSGARSLCLTVNCHNCWQVSNIFSRSSSPNSSKDHPASVFWDQQPQITLLPFFNFPSNVDLSLLHHIATSPPLSFPTNSFRHSTCPLHPVPHATSTLPSGDTLRRLLMRCLSLRRPGEGWSLELQGD